MLNIRSCALLGLLCCLVGVAPTVVQAHDTWVETNTAIVRTGDSLYVSLKLGNHGNEHRDFKLANKIDLESSTLAVIDPEGTSFDVKDRAVDTGYAPREGYWEAKFVAAKPGLYTVAHTLDKLHGTTRAIKSAKAFFIVNDSLDKVPLVNPGYDKPLGHTLEIVPEANPVAPMGPGEPISIRVLYNGQPMAGARVTFIPRGAQLSEGFDDRYERNTDEKGRASFTPKEGNYVLVVVHHREPEQKGEGFTATAYSATLTVLVPDICPCCE